MSINTLSLILAIPATIAAWLAFRLGYLHKQAPDRRGNLPQGSGLDPDTVAGACR